MHVILLAWSRGTLSSLIQIQIETFGVLEGQKKQIQTQRIRFGSIQLGIHRICKICHPASLDIMYMLYNVQQNHLIICW